MKKLKLLLTAAVCLAILIVSCKKDSNELENPQLIISEDSLIFHDNETKFLYLSTQPASLFEFRVISSPDWLVVFPDSGIIDNSIKEVAVSTVIEHNKPDVYTGDIEIMSTAGTGIIAIKAIIGENLKYYIPDIIAFSIYHDSIDFIFENDGNIDIDFSLSCPDGLLTLPVSNGNIQVNEDLKIPVLVNKDNLDTGIYDSEIYVTINNVIDTISVVIESFKEQKTRLNLDVIDAEYSKSHNLIYFVSSTPSKFNLFNPDTKLIESIELTYVPTCLSLSPDSETAVVGHDGHISVISLNPLSIVKTTYVSCQAYDIVLSSENWAYVMPDEDQWTKMKCIDLETGAEIESEGNLIYEDTKARLHPSGKYIYTADNDLEKFDISGGVAVYLYDSPYHQDYPIRKNLWYSEDGLRIFTAGGSVFRTSEIQQNDMLYNGSIDLDVQYYYGSIVWLDHSSLSSNLFIVQGGEDYDDPNQPKVKVYDATNLVYKNEMLLEEFLVPNGFGGGEFYQPEPYFVFANSSDYEIYVITKAVGSGLLHEWAIQTLNY